MSSNRMPGAGRTVLPVLVMLVLAMLAAAGVAAANLKSIAGAGGEFKPENEEVALWAQTHREERHLLTNKARYKDPRLLDYLDAMVARMTPPGMAANRHVRYRVRVILDPTINAFAYAHGSMYISSGLLVRLENEHQLAALLGHEMSHVDNRHTLRKIRDARKKRTLFTIAGLIADVALAREVRDLWRKAEFERAFRVGVLGELMLDVSMNYAFLASVNGYGRAMETEADTEGFDKVIAGKYDAREMPKLFEILRKDQGETGAVRAYFYGTHPRLNERIENSQRLVAGRRDAVPAGPAAEPSREFIEALAPLVRDHAAFEKAAMARQ